MKITKKELSELIQESFTKNFNLLIENQSNHFPKEIFFVPLNDIGLETNQGEAMVKWIPGHRDPMNPDEPDGELYILGIRLDGNSESMGLESFTHSENLKRMAIGSDPISEDDLEKKIKEAVWEAFKWEETPNNNSMDTSAEEMF